MSELPIITYTKTDEAPALATYSLLPIVQAFTKHSGITVETSDISLAGRILANFPDALTPEQRVPDALSSLGKLAMEPSANIIKLPNISASVPNWPPQFPSFRPRATTSPDFPAASEVRCREDGSRPLRQNQGQVP